MNGGGKKPPKKPTNLNVTIRLATEKEKEELREYAEQAGYETLSSFMKAFFKLRHKLSPVEMRDLLYHGQVGGNSGQMSNGQ